MKCPKCKQEVPGEILAQVARGDPARCPSCNVGFTVNRAAARKADVPPAPQPPAEVAKPIPPVAKPTPPPTAAAPAPGWLAQYMDELGDAPPIPAKRPVPTLLGPAVAPRPPTAKPEPTPAPRPESTAARPLAKRDPAPVAAPPPAAAAVPEPPPVLAAEPPTVVTAAPPTFDAAEPPTVVTAAPPIFDAAEPPTVAAPEPPPTVAQALARVDTPPPSRLSALAPAQVVADVPAADVHSRRRRILLAGPALLIAGVSLAAGLRARRTAPPAAPGRADPPLPQLAAPHDDFPTAAAAAVPEKASPPAPRRRRVQPPAVKRLATVSAPGSRQSGTPRSPAAADQAYRRGNERLLAGDATSASQAYRQAISLDPTLAVAHRGLGLAEAQLSNRRASVRALRRYLQLAPTAPDREPIRARIRLLSSKS